jgi:hypothetical protein
MKNTRWPYFIILLLIVTSCSHQNSIKNNGIIETRLSTLLTQKEYFKLSSQLESDKDSIAGQQRLFFRAFVDNAFNKNERSIKEIDTLLQNYAAKLSDSAKAILYLLQDDSYFKTFQYAKSAQNERVVLSQYSTVLDSGKIRDVKNSFLLCNALKGVPPQQIVKMDSSVINWKKDKVGLIEIPVRCNGTTPDAIFDTRANISSISETYATKLGLKILNVSYDEGSGITGLRFKTGLGVADSLYIGNILIRNAIFQVMPDSVLYIAPIQFSMNIIIGFPIIEQLQEVQIYKDGRMIIPLKPSASPLHNLALDGLDPVLALKENGTTLPFYFDSGAGNSVLYSTYFRKYKSKILREGRIKKAQFGGAGGIRNENVYVLPALYLFLGNKKITLDSIDILTRQIDPKEKFYGNIGRDFMSRFDEMILNFKSMYVEGR